MDNRRVSANSGLQEHHFVKADEVDQTGADISPVSDEQLMEEVAEGLRGEQVLASANSTSDRLAKQNKIESGRPALHRDGVAPPPPLQPPPPAPAQQAPDRATDSLSLAQLRQLVGGLPKAAEQPAYAFEYADTQPFVDELEEWFQYSEFDRAMLMGMRISFDNRWNEFRAHQPSDSQDVSWITASYDLRKYFMTQALDDLGDHDLYARVEALEAICYLITGVWGLTAGKVMADYPEDSTSQVAMETPRFKSLQIKWMENDISLLQECSGIAALHKQFCRVFDKARTDSDVIEPENTSSVHAAASEREANLILTALYFVVEVGRRQEAFDNAHTPIRDEVSELDPNLMVFLVEIIARLRWDESANIPLTRVVLLLWKLLLLCFGGSQPLARAKDELEPHSKEKMNDPSQRTPFLTASPLDYQAFRQEITSKYPAYKPPPPVVPLELESNSILPPLPQNFGRANSSSGFFPGIGPSAPGDNGSILHHSVHIATPAPSPPPSPIGPGGKAGKKQNYQTNQNFPFMYPPLDENSNDIGGKGTTEHQDTLVGKKWEGSDVPASIIEAGKLFSSHVKMTRAIRQLWEERERFMKYDRGWNFEDCIIASSNALGSITQAVQGLELSEKRHFGSKEPPGKETNEDVQRRLDTVENFYAQALPHLQSITIVFLKIILTNISAVVNQANGQNGHVASNPYGTTNGPISGQNSFSVDLDCDAAVEEMDNIRLREVTGKAVSGSLLLLLKWFKRSHILKFEYMTQLLLDSNYLPLILKMFAHQDIDQAIAHKNDREDLGFFHFCQVHSNQDQPTVNLGDESCGAEEEAVPPPIPRNRPDVAAGNSSTGAASPEESLPEFLEHQPRPEVDELGYPTAPPPKEPITTFSFRNFFSAINYLHIMQKITRGKAHRCLLLVQYKSSAILRKGLKIPDPRLRLYTLKLFKSQVPYCGRKWRQSNMRVITAIYLYCRPSLRDDWLSGSDVDAEVEEALPYEQALRGLTHWWHLRKYKDVMGGEEGTTLMEEERDFFVRELEALGWGLFGDDVFGVADEGDLAGPGGPLMNGTQWDGGPLGL